MLSPDSFLQKPVRQRLTKYGVVTTPLLEPLELIKAIDRPFSAGHMARAMPQVAYNANVEQTRTNRSGDCRHRLPITLPVGRGRFATQPWQSMPTHFKTLDLPKPPPKDSFHLKVY